MNAVRFDARTTPGNDLQFHGSKNKGHRAKTLVKSGRLVMFANGNIAVFKNKKRG